MDGRTAQADIYGEPLSEILARCGAALGLNQSGLADVLGISAPMLSQLVNARRVKIGNPVAAQRLQVMHAATEEIARGDLDARTALVRIAAVHGGGDILTTRRSSREDTVAQMQDLFRRVASAADYLAAAEQLAANYPDIAEVLRLYGAGRTDEASAHLARLRGTA